MIAEVGSRFGRWSVIGIAPKRGKNHYRICECDCGTQKEVAVSNLKQGSSSCGCLYIENLRQRITKHGMTGTPEYKAWSAAKSRCYKSNHPEYKNYGARGITMCPEWVSDFSQFYMDMGPRPKGLSLERVEVNKGYNPENCVWADYKTQCANKRTSLKNRTVMIGGREVPLPEAITNYGFEWKFVKQRLENGWSTDDAFQKPHRYSLTTLPKK